jgi:hypothetical protein
VDEYEATSEVTLVLNGIVIAIVLFVSLMVPGTPFSEKVVIALNVEAALTPLPTTPPPPQPVSASIKAATDKNIRNAILFNIGVSVFNSASPYFAISNECATQTLCL